MDNPTGNHGMTRKQQGFPVNLSLDPIVEHIKLEQPGQTFQSIDGRLFFEMQTDL